MPIGSILTDKESASTYQPLLLATVSLSDGTTARFSSHAVTYGGDDYMPRVLNQDIAASQALGEQGIDVPATVNLRLSDADLYLWSNHEMVSGFKGSKLTLVIVMYDVVANAFSSDSRVIFQGTCKEPGGRMPSHDGKVLTIGYVSRLMLSDISLPTIRVQKTCPWSFPETLAQRQDGADSATSQFYQCGYSPDATGANARGNYESGSTPFLACDRTKANCVARGMYTQDSSMRTTGRFGGIQWNPPQAYSVRDYVQGKWQVVAGGANEARYGDNIPMLWGKAWTDPLILNTVPDGNYLKMEALICYGELDYIFEVVVNDTKIPHTFDDTEFAAVGPGVATQSEALKGGWWKATNRGDRDGAPTSDSGYTDSSGAPQGDPYGSYAVIEIVVPRKVADAGAVPRVRVLAQRGSHDPTAQIQEILTTWCGWDASELNTAEFSGASALAVTPISYTDMFGGTGSHDRFSSSLYLRQRESAAEVIRGLRANMRGVLAVDSDGKFALRVKGTLASQQNATVSGSNYLTAVSSHTLAGTTTNGYVAYRFDEGNIIVWPQVSETTAGNRYAVQFQNADNRYSYDTYSPIDSEDIARVDQDIQGGVSIRGAESFDQLARLIATYTAEQYRGNPRGDTGGTLVFNITASIRAVHLMIGDICMLNWEPLGLSDQLVRVLAIKPSTNFETAELSLAWHDDSWYLDTYGQRGQPAYTSNHRNRLLRPAYSWLPYGEAPISGDSLHDFTDYGFTIRQVYEDAADGSVVAKLEIQGKQVVNVTLASPNPPSVPLQGTTSSTLGTLDGGRTYYVALVAKDSAGKYSALSHITTIAVPTGTSTNVITVPSIKWDSATAGYVVFAGTDINRLSAQADGSGTPPSVTLGSLSEALWGAPDGEFDRYRIRVKRVIHGGLLGTAVVSVTTSTIKLATQGSGFTTDQFAGYDLTWYAPASVSNALKIANFRITSNTSDTLTVTGANPVTVGMTTGDVVVMRSVPTFGTDGTGTYLEDANWVNCFAASGLIVDDEKGRVIRFIAGTGRGLTARIKSNTATKVYADFPFTPDSTSRYIIEEPAWQVIVDSEPVTNSDPSAPMYALVDVRNYSGQALLVQVLTLDGGDTESFEVSSPVREIYLRGDTASGSISSSVALTVDGTIAIGSDLAPRISLNSDARALAVKAEVKIAPSGDDIAIDIYANGIGGSPWMTLVIPDGSTSVTATGTQILNAVVVGGGYPIKLDLTAVGSTYPGSDLTVQLFF